jgi:hypothetical protein
MAISTGAAILGAGALAAGSGLLSSNAASKAAAASSASQLKAAKLAADAQRFRPVGMTTRFGTSNFGFDAAGNLTSAGYDLSPELKGYQDFVAGQLGGATNDVSGLLSLGRGYLATSPEEARQQYIDQQNALYAPMEEQNLAGLRNQLYRTGRTGLATGGTSAGGLMATNPEMAAYYNALAQREAQTVADAEQAVQQRIGFGQGLLSSAYSPLTTGLGVLGSIESLGQTPLALGAELGGRSATAGANVGQSLLRGGLSAAQTLQAANQYSPAGAVLGGVANSPYVSQWFQNAINQPTTNYGLTGNLSANPAYNPAMNYSGTYNPAMGTTSWYD